MKNDFIIRHYRDESILMLFSYLETLPENSRFIIRLMYASTKSLIQLKHHGIKHNEIISLLRFGMPQLEDPQEVMFTQQVGSPYGSFTVFPGNFMFYQDNLTRLLNIAGVCGISKKYLSLVYFFLHLSQLVADRTSSKRYDGGMPENQEFFIPDKERIAKEINSVFIHKTLMDDICKQYEIPCEVFIKLICTASRKELREDLQYQGYSDRVTLSPFLKYQSGYIILHPSALLHCAYYFCKGLLINELGKDRLYKIMTESIINEVGCILKSDSGSAVIGRGKIQNTADYLLYSIDAIHAISIIPIVAERKINIIKTTKVIEQYVSEQYKGRSVILHLVVYTQIEDDPFGLVLPHNGNAVALSLDDFAVVMNHPKMTLKNLYYYKEDKKDFMYPPMSQEMDLLSYYIDANFTFYTENKPDFILAEIGTALRLRIDYYTKSDIRYIYYPFLNKTVPMHHFADIPKGIPLYVPLYAPQSINILMVDLSTAHLFFIPDDSVKNAKLFYEVCHSIALWLYAAYYKRHVNILNNDICLIINFDKDIIKETTKNGFILLVLH